MDLATITMDRAEARQAFLDYRRAVRDRHNEEDAQIMRGYRELSKGRRLIHLSQTFAAGGTVERVRRNETVHLPALAVARADLAEVYVRADGYSDAITFLPSVEYRGRRDRITVRGVRPEGCRSWVSCAPGWGAWRAMVPPVPPALRPSHHLRNYHILWEAEWAFNTPPRPPGDPALLKRIAGDLFVVLAVWDLTPLEKAVLSARGHG